MIITTAHWKACTPDTCMTLRSGTDVQGNSLFATVFLNYQEKMTDLSCKMSLGKLKKKILNTVDKWYKINMDL